MRLTLDPFVIAYLGAVLGLYLRAVRVLRRRGFDVPHRQQAAWYGGLALSSLALVSPVNALGEDLLSMHMAQHLLIADLAAPLLLVGLRSPVLVFMLPRPALVALARRRRLRAVLRFLRQPLVALPLFVLLLYAWHIRFMFEGAVRDDWMHTLQHTSFVVGAMLVWWPALEPKKRRMPGDLWKIGHIFAARLASAMLGMAFVFMTQPAYPGVYGERARDYGLSPLADQQTAGGMMMTLDVLVIVFALSLFFWRAARDYDDAQRATPESA